jgi:predicted alpha/beta hydrolase family esterase
MYHYLIIHGAYGNPQENWFPWLKTQLADSGHVEVPAFPTPENQNLKTWMTIAEEKIVNCSPDRTFIIGHSTGALLAMRLAEKTSKPYRGIFLACPFAKDLGLSFDQLNSSFIHPEFDWNRTKQGASSIYCYAGDNDPYVPLPYTQEIADLLNGDLKVIPNGGHLNENAGMIEFPLIVTDIMSLR